MTTQLAAQLQTALGSDYRVEEPLVGGGMSRLFLTTDLRHNRRVVAKVLSADLANPTSAARFKREIELTVQLQHPHILPILTSGGWGDVLYYITPFIPGESLRNRIARDKKLPLDDILKILRDVSEALAFAHERGIVHRDVKPGNILLAEGQAILADFGIARSVSTDETPVTGSGMIPGTPAYMAPELTTDEKADVYALGVVAYEMLCGTLPKRGVTAKEIVEARGVVDGDRRQRLESFAGVVASALQASPETRTANARALADDLETLRPGHRRPLSRRALAAIALSIGAVSVAGLWYARRNVSLDRDGYVVLPVGAATPVNTAASDAIRAALREWQGLNSVEATASAVKGIGPSPQAADAGTLARSTGVRNGIAVEATAERDSIVIRATLVDAQTKASVKMRPIAYAATGDAPSRAMQIRRLVNGIVRDGDELPWSASTDTRTPSIAAWRSYDEGRAALKRWDLDAAVKSFRGALAADQDLALAQVWLAQSLIWSVPKGIPSDARGAARRALDARAGLSSRDSTHAAALLAMADSEFVVARRAFDALVARDSTDLAGWLGLADLQARDREVVRDPRSRTRWSFRTSHERAARSYQRAGEIGPTGQGAGFQGWLLGRLSVVLYPAMNKIRLGRSTTAPDTGNFAAFPYMDHDTIAFAPYPLKDFGAGRENPPLAVQLAAVTRSRAVLRGAAEDWVRRSPRSAAAYDSLASWVEISGGFASVGERQMSTLDVVRQARGLSKDSAQQLRLALFEVRLLVKDGKFAAARAAADSLFRAGVARHIAEAEGIPGLAVLLGHRELAAQLFAAQRGERRIQTSDGAIVVLPPQLAEVYSRLLAYAAVGGGVDSIPLMAKRTMDLVSSYFTDSARVARVRSALLVPALTLAYPAGSDMLRSMDLPTEPTTRVYALLARGDTASARTGLADIRRIAAGVEPGSAIDGNLRRARLSLILGDTAAAVAELDPILRALPKLTPSLLDEVVHIGSLVNALALRADLADRARDRATATQCANAVATLWADADDSLKPLAARMRALAH